LKPNFPRGTWYPSVSSTKPVARLPELAISIAIALIDRVHNPMAAVVGVPLLLATTLSLISGLLNSVGITVPEAQTRLEALSWASVGAAFVTVVVCWLRPSFTCTVAAIWALVCTLLIAAPSWVSMPDDIMITAVVRMAQCAAGIMWVVSFEAILRA
jgi:hypothetical protein